MAVTATNTFTVTRDDIIKAALRVLGVIGIGENPITEDYTNCSQALNIMIKGWSRKGFPLWVTEEKLLDMVPGVFVYPLGPEGGQLNTNGITITNGGTGGVDGTYTLGIVDATGTGAAGTFVVSGGTITSITITAAGTGYTAPSYTWSTSGISGAVISTVLVGLKMSRPLSLNNIYIRDTTTNIDVPLRALSRTDYQLLGNRFAEAKPNQYYFDVQLETANLYIYNVPNATNYELHLQTERQFYDMTNGTDTFDFPQGWFQALKWGLAAELCVEYAVDIQMVSYYEQKAQEMIEEAFNDSVEETSVYFTRRRW